MCDLIKENCFTEKQTPWLISAHKHFSEQMFNRFNVKISLNTYVSIYVKKNNHSKDFTKRLKKKSFIKKVVDLNKIVVYSVMYGLEYPITIYAIDELNFGKCKSKKKRKKKRKKGK